ncbi:MAG: tRNA lysidine(34) synthetase TilS [Clostridiaceae bacterium]
MLNLIDKVLDTMEKYKMMSKGSRIIVGVSGGPDSMCLLHILLGMRDSLDLELVAAHVNHSLRGVDADKDAEYVEEFCKANNIEFASIKIDVHKLAAEKNVSEETAGRDLRYEFFERLRKEYKADKIAIAHNLNDQAETVIMRIIRGTGLEGLAGIKPVRDEIYIRPLLFCSRAEIEEYCSINNLNPRIDKTNFESIYVRNKIRLELIPYIEKNFNKDIINVLNRLAQNSKADSEYLEHETKNKYKIYCTYKDYKVIISKEAFLEHEAIVTRLIRKAFEDVCGNLRNFERQHILQVIDLQKNGTGKQALFPNNAAAFNNYGDISIYIRSKASKEAGHPAEYELHMGKNPLKALGLTVTVEEHTLGEMMNDDSLYTKYFDCGKASGNITLRFRKPGDRFRPLGMEGTKKLKDIFIDLKVPQEEREKTPLICFGDEIAWIVGYKMGNSFKIDKNTKKVLKMKMESEE